MKRVVFMLLCWTWCLPQTFLGWCVIGFYRVRRRICFPYHWRYQRGFFVCSDVLSGFSLGYYQALTVRFFRAGNDIVRTTKKHEWGHCKQSLILGPLYLVVVGLPSVLWNLLSRLSYKVGSRYYRRFPENWADRLGGVVRDK